MPLVDAKCKACGANLKVDAEQKMAFCSYCGAKYMVEQAIEYYNVQNNVYVSAKGDAEKERLIKNAKTYLDLFEYEKATKIYEQIIEDYPDDHRGWYGIASILSRQFSKPDCEPGEFNKVGIYVSRALKFAEGEDKDRIKAEWDKYFNEHTAFITAKKNEADSYLKTASELSDKYTKGSERYKQELKKRDDLLGKKNQIKIGKGVGWLFWFLVGVIAAIASLTVFKSMGNYRYILLVIGLLVSLISLITPLSRIIKKLLLKDRTDKYEQQQKLCEALSVELNDLKSQIVETRNRATVIRGVYKF